MTTSTSTSTNDLANKVRRLAARAKDAADILEHITALYSQAVTDGGVGAREMTAIVRARRFAADCLTGMMVDWDEVRNRTMEVELPPWPCMFSHNPASHAELVTAAVLGFDVLRLDARRLRTWARKAAHAAGKLGVTP